MRPNQSQQHAALLVAQIAIAGTLCALLLLLAERHNQRFDLSPTQSYVLSETSRQVAAGIKVPIQITAFYNSQEQGQRRQMQDVLDLFAMASPNITYRLVDLDRSPALAAKYGIGNTNSGVIEGNGTVHELRQMDEEEITNGLLKLTRRTERKLCFVTGHGEHNPYENDERTGYSEVGKALEKEHFDIAALPNVPPSGIPSNCTVVVIAGPRKDLLPGEADQLSRYLDAGGQVLLMVDPGASASVLQFLEQHGVRAGKDVVLDERNRLMGTDSSMLHVPAFNKAVFRADLETAVFPVARTMFPIDDESSSNHVVVLALSSTDSWAYVNDGALPDGDVKFRRDIDQPGPLPVAVMIIEGEAPANESAPPAAKPGRMIAFGDSDFPSNLSLNWRGNKDVFMSSVALLAEDQELVAVRRKGAPHGSMSPIYLTES